MAAVLIFDGDCGFCTTTATAMVRNTTQPIDAIAWQLAEIDQYGVSKAEAAKRVYLVIDGQIFPASKAVAKVLRLQKATSLRVLGSLLSIPPISWLAIPGYSLVAKFRHRLPGGTPACKLG